MELDVRVHVVYVDDVQQFNHRVAIDLDGPRRRREQHERLINVIARGNRVQQLDLAD